MLGGFVVNIIRIDEEGVVVVIDIVNAEVEGEQTRIQRKVHVGAQVEAMIVAHAEVVAFQGVDVLEFAPIVGQSFINLRSERAAIATAENPSAAQVELVAELVLHGDADVVATVVFGRKHFSIINYLSLAVELPLGMCPSVANPTRCFAETALHEQLHAVGPAFAHANFLVPSLRGAEK